MKLSELRREIADGRAGNAASGTQEVSKKKQLALSVLLLVVGLIWGIGFVAVKVALNAGYTSSMINLGRFALASVLTFAFFFKEIRTLKLSELKDGFITAVFMAVGFFCQNTGMNYTTPGNASLITGLYIVLVPFFSALIIKTKVPFIAYIAAILSFAGIIVLSVPSYSGGEVQIGDLLVFIGAVSFSFHFLFLARALEKVSAVKMTFIQLFLTSLIFLVYFLIFDLGKLSAVELNGLWAIGFLGVFSSFFAYLAQSYAQKYLPPTRVAILMSTECLFGAIFSVAFGFEPFTLWLLLGGILTIGGLVLAQVNQK